MVKWTEGSRLRLIQEYKSRPQLYETSGGSKAQRSKAIAQVAEALNQYYKTDVFTNKDVSAQFRSLKNTYSNNITKIEEMLAIGKNDYQPTWPFFKHLHFLNIGEEDELEEPVIRNHRSQRYQKHNLRATSSRKISSRRSGTSKRPASTSPEEDQENAAKKAAPIDWARFVQEMSAKGDPRQRQPLKHFNSGPVASTPISGDASSNADVSEQSNEVENPSPELQSSLRHFRSDASDASSSMPDIKNVKRLHPLMANMYFAKQQPSVPAVRRSTIKSEALGQSIQLGTGANSATASTIRQQIREPLLEPVLTLAIRPPVEVEPMSREQHDDLPEYMVVEDDNDENFEKFGKFVANTLKRLFKNFPRCAVRAKNNVRDLLFQTELRKLQNGYAHV